MEAGRAKSACVPLLLTPTTKKCINTRWVFLAARRFIWAAASSQHRSSGLHAKAMAGVSEREKVDGQRDSKGNIASPRALLLELHALRTLNRDIGIYWACFYSYPPSFTITGHHRTCIS
jgi:hypothetical protein